MFNPRTFPCPSCNEIINEGMKTCNFCSTPVDSQAAINAAELQEKVNNACSDASYTKIVSQALFVFIALGFTPIVSGLGNLGFLGGFFAVPIMAFRWQMKFGKLKTIDPDYRKAKRAKNIALLLWLAAAPLRFVIVPILLALLFQSFSNR